MSIETLLLLLNIAIVGTSAFMNWRTQDRKAKSAEALDWSNVAKGLREELTAQNNERRSYEAVSTKRFIELGEERKELKRELTSWKLAYAELRQVAAKYVPKEVDLPEPNGNTITPQDFIK